MSRLKPFAALIAVALASAAAAATVAPQLLLDVDFAPRDIAKVEIGDFHFLPGQKAPIHTHAAPAIGYVSKGTIYYQVEGQPAQILKAGDAFFEPVGPRILHFDNASATDEAVFTDFNLQQVGEPFIVFEHAPTEKIDRRTFPTAPIVATATHGATGHRERFSGRATRHADQALLGYVAAGSLSVRVNGGAVQRIAQGQTWSAPADATVQLDAGTGATVVTFTLKR
ncbi:MAG: cupin domain-containing protein [Sphingomonas sp.]|nr:cupin domain-containing protein [Sphingomonas sp.]